MFLDDDFNLRACLEADGWLVCLSVICFETFDWSVSKVSLVLRKSIGQSVRLSLV